MNKQVSGESAESQSVEERLARSLVIYEDFVNRRASGEDVDTEEYLRLHPELEVELKELFDKVREDAHVDEEADLEGASDSALMEGGRVLGDFRILEGIGEGAMATVYEAEQISLKRRVALKVLSPHLSLSPGAVARFRREGEAIARQRHPSIVQVHSVGKCGKLHYIAEELVEGGYTLAERIRELKQEDDLPLGYFREAAELVRDVAMALGMPTIRV